jgi:hypothetical protein
LRVRLRGTHPSRWQAAKRRGSNLRREWVGCCTSPRCFRRIDRCTHRHLVLVHAAKHQADPLAAPSQPRELDGNFGDLNDDAMRMNLPRLNPMMDHAGQFAEHADSPASDAKTCSTR